MDEKRSKSLAERAATHSGWANEVVRASSSTKVRGKRTRRVVSFGEFRERSRRPVMLAQR